MHLHGMKMAILYSGEYTEEYDESKFNPNPVYRDTVTVNCYVLEYFGTYFGYVLT
jgi:hypothetical protein